MFRALVSLVGALAAQPPADPAPPAAELAPPVSEAAAPAAEGPATEPAQAPEIAPATEPAQAPEIAPAGPAHVPTPTPEAAPPPASPASPSPASPSAEGTAAPVEEAPPMIAMPALAVGGFVDFYYAYNGNEPLGRVNFVPGTGSTAKRHNELSLNLAAVDLVLDPAPVGGRLTLAFGTGSFIVHAGEPLGVGVGPEVFASIYQAYGTVEVPWIEGLVIDGGVFPCHVGMEAFFSKDNWNYTRSWLGELSPYYSAGVRATYAITEAWSAQLHLVNGWQSIGDVNVGKTLGTQLAYNSELLSVSLNGLFGPEVPADGEHWRAFGNLLAVFRPLEWLQLGASLDAGYQALPGGDSAVWHAGAGYARWMPLGGVAVSARGEYYADLDGFVTGTPQTLVEGTLTAEWRPYERLILKLEGRYDHSTRPVFTAAERAPDGTPTTTDAQLLGVLGAVVTL